MSKFACFTLKSSGKAKKEVRLFLLKKPRAAFLIIRAGRYRLLSCGTINLIQSSVYIVIKSFFQLFTVTNRKKWKEKSISLPKTNKKRKNSRFSMRRTHNTSSTKIRSLLKCCQKSCSASAHSSVHSSFPTALFLKLFQCKVFLFVRAHELDLKNSMGHGTSTRKFESNKSTANQ